jgi:glutamine phosphoribosylpyrophosphate amidotransferase
MCEQFVARAAQPFELGELWPLAERLERYGIAGFGWGAAWIEGGGIESHRDVRAFRDDPARDALATRRTTSLLVHLRRPSKLSTIGLPDTQPFDDPAGRYAFSHNGDFEHDAAWREAYRATGRIRGRADTEVGARWLEDAWATAGHPPDALRALHDAFGGEANLAVLLADGGAHHYAGNRENPVFTFRLGRIAIAATGLYSIDRSIFRFAAPGATNRRLVPIGSTASLGRDGAVTIAGGRVVAPAEVVATAS